MQWNNLNDFLAMGGYALYVWGSFGVCAAAMIIEPLFVRHRRKLALRSIKNNYLM